jgi:hypothetical protein
VVNKEKHRLQYVCEGIIRGIFSLEEVRMPDHESYGETTRAYISPSIACFGTKKYSELSESGGDMSYDSLV